MKNLRTIMIVSFLLILSIPHQAFAQQQNTLKKFKMLEWLLGDWQRTNAKPGQSGYENWSKLSETRFTGKGITLKGKETIFTEELELSVQGTAIFYTVTISGEPKPIQFKLTAITKDSFVFENQQHDFPTKIAYTRSGNRAKAIVSGNGKTLVYEFLRQTSNKN